MREERFLNQGAVNVEVHTQMRNTLSISEMKKAIRNHLLFNAILIIHVINTMNGTQIHASDVDQRIISSQIVQKQTIWIRKFTGTWKNLKLMHCKLSKF